MRPELLIPMVLFASSGCLSDTSPGGEVGSETHFLSACVSHEDCPSALECLCGVCTTACTTTCGEGTCASGDSAAVGSFCGAPRDVGLCLATCDGTCACDDGACLAEPRPAGSRCTVAADCDGGDCTLGYCGPACMLPEADCPEGTSCHVPGAAAGVCLPGVLESYPDRLDAGAIEVGTSKDMVLDIASRGEDPLEVIQIAVETLDQTEPTEVVVLTAVPATFAPPATLTVTVRITPARAGRRPYRLIVRARDVPIWLEVPVEFSGVNP